MKASDCINCETFPCSDINKDGYIIPSSDIDTKNIKIIMISEAPPENQKDYFYSSDSSFYLTTTIQAFNDAEALVTNIKDIVNLGVYLTTAIKCAKTQYTISTETIKNWTTVLLWREKGISFISTDG